MKQVVINGGETHGGLLTPKWTIEYYKRNGIELYYYLAELFEDDFTYVLTNANELDNNAEIYHGYYLLKNVGKEIENIYELDCSIMFDEYDMFKNREDKVLIDIAKEINDEKLIKIIEIPDDVEYNVVQSDCGFREYVEEKHRVWS